MKKDFLDQLARASYEARCELLIGGTYHKAAVRIPDELHFYTWEEIPEPILPQVQWLWREQTEASLEAFLFFIHMHGSPEAKRAMGNILHELRHQIFTDRERAELNYAEPPQGEEPWQQYLRALDEHEKGKSTGE